MQTYGTEMSISVETPQSLSYEEYGHLEDCFKEVERMFSADPEVVMAIASIDAESLKGLIYKHLESLQGEALAEIEADFARV